MKTVLIVVLFCCGGFLSAQENPWTPKGENPWPTTNSTKVSESSTSETKAEADTIIEIVQQPEKTDSEKIDSLSVVLKEDVLSQYGKGKDYAVGFGIGMLMGLTGIFADAIYTGSSSKAEKRIMENVKSDSTYQQIPEKVLVKKTKRTIKNKKFSKALGGTMTAVAVRILMITIIITR